MLKRQLGTWVAQQSSSVHKAFIFHYHPWEVLNTFLTYTVGCFNIYSEEYLFHDGGLEHPRVRYGQQEDLGIYCLCEICP